MNLRDNYKEGRLQFDLAAAAGNAGVLSVLNDSGEDLLIEDAIVKIATAVAGQTFDMGVAATAVSADGVMDGQSLANVARLMNALNPGTNGKSRVVWPSGQYLTITASGTPTGLVGKAEVWAKPLA